MTVALGAIIFAVPQQASAPGRRPNELSLCALCRRSLRRTDRCSATHGRQVFVKCGMANTSLVNARLTFEPIDGSHQDSTVIHGARHARVLSPSLTHGDHHEKNCTHHLRCAADLRIGGPNGSGFPAPPPQQGPPQQFSRSLQSGERADQRPSNPTSLPTGARFAPDGFRRHGRLGKHDRL